MKKIIPAILIALFLVAGTAAAEGETVGWVTGFHGIAYVERPDVGKTVVRLGLGVSQKDQIVTEKGGKVKILFADNSILTLGGRSRLKLRQCEYLIHQGSRTSEFELIQGRVKLLVGKEPVVHTDIRLVSPTAIASVTGTMLIVEYDKVRDATRILTVTGRVGVSNADPKVPGVFQVSNREITTVYRGRLPEQPRNVTKTEFQKYLAATHVADQARLSKMPGHAGNVVDNPVAGFKESDFSSAYDKSFGAESEGEGGAEFEAFSVNRETDRLSDSDLPLPGDNGDNASGISDNPTDEDVSVGISLQFRDDNDEDSKGDKK